jgi:hypothetical protein
VTDLCTTSCGNKIPRLSSRKSRVFYAGADFAFSEEVTYAAAAFGFSWRTKTINFRTAIFRQVNKDVPRVHHDALEFPDGTCVLLTELREDQEATVLQLPAQPTTPAEEAAQKRVTYVG